MASRSDRMHPKGHKNLHTESDVYTSEGETDRDRLQQSLALRRLSGVTQVISPVEGHLIHNRLTHTLRVAQIGRKIAQRLLKIQPKESSIAELDPFVVEAAALAHDLGHPPFGHIAESELNDIVSEYEVEDGFEGNAQSFRIVTNLIHRSHEYEGLNLSRATLDAILKYPWFREVALDKWGAYHTEENEYNFARALHTPGDRAKSTEACLMDIADEIAYVLDDVEDFYRTGFIDFENALRWGIPQIVKDGYDYFGQHFTSDQVGLIAEQLIKILPFSKPFTGSRDSIVMLGIVFTTLTKRYIESVSLHRVDDNLVVATIQPEQAVELYIFKQMTRLYVINDIQLQRQQHGQRKIIRTLFEALFLSTDLLPTRFKEKLERLSQLGELVSGMDHHTMKVRIVADAVSSMTDSEALAMHGILTGANPHLMLSNHQFT